MNTLQSSQKKLFKNTGIMSIAVFFSRILGLVRDQVMAAYFGTSYVNDAFSVAFNIPNLLRRLFGEGALSASFIPIYNELGFKRNRRYQMLFALNVLNILTVILGLLTILGILFTPLIIKYVYPGLAPETAQLAVKLTYIMFPYLFFIGLSSTFIAILNSHNYFFVTGLSSALLNVGWIVSIIIGSWCTGNTEELIYFTAWGTIFGGFLQTAINIPLLKKIGYNFKIFIKLNSLAMKTLWKRFIPGMLGLGIREINLLMDAFIASFLPIGSIAALGFGNRLMQLPLGIFGIAAGTAVLPAFSKAFINKDFEELSNSLRFSILFMIYIMIPVTALIIGGSKDIIILLFQRGIFDAHATNMTVIALTCYSIGLVFFGLNQTITPVFYAAKDTKTPVLIAAVMVVLNITLNIILMIPLKHGGLALATSITAMVQFFVMLRLLKKRYKDIKITKIIFNLIKILIISVIIYLLVSCFSHNFIAQSFILKLFKVIILVAIWLFVFAIGGFSLKLDYWNIFSERLCRKFLKK